MLTTDCIMEYLTTETIWRRFDLAFYPLIAQATPIIGLIAYHWILCLDIPEIVWLFHLDEVCLVAFQDHNAPLMYNHQSLHSCKGNILCAYRM